MRQVKDKIYEDLTPRERVIATLAAEVRGDEAEVRRLVATCPKCTYRGTDERYAGTMRAIALLSIFLEMELRGYALAWAVSRWEGHGDEDNNDNDNDNAFVLLRRMLGVRQAWHEALVARGLDPVAVEAFAAPLRSPMVDFLLDAGDATRATLTPDDEAYEAEVGHPPPEALLSPLAPRPDDIAPWREMVEAYLEGGMG